MPKYTKLLLVLIGVPLIVASWFMVFPFNKPLIEANATDSLDYTIRLGIGESYSTDLVHYTFSGNKIMGGTSTFVRYQGVITRGFGYRSQQLYVDEGDSVLIGDKFFTVVTLGEDYITLKEEV